jgi:predicted enzyme related to lactoylglutathione lyase
VKVKRVGFLGVRTDKVAEMTAFFRDVIGLRGRRTDDNWTSAQLPSGPWDLVEVFSEDFDDERLIPAEVDGVFVAFFVDDLDEARRDAESAGAEIVGENVVFENHAIGWFFVRAPDGRIYVIQQAPD